MPGTFLHLSMRRPYNEKVTFFKKVAFWDLSSQQRHLAGLRNLLPFTAECSDFYPVDIQSGWHVVAAGIFAVPAQGMIAGVSHPAPERSHCFAQNVVDGHPHPRRFRQLKADLRLWVERIREILS